MGYLVLFLGTPYMDGAYPHMLRAIAAREHLRKLYPEIKIEIVRAIDGFIIFDEIFWADHKKELEAFNKLKGKEKYLKAGKHLTIV